MEQKLYKQNLTATQPQLNINLPYLKFDSSVPGWVTVRLKECHCDGPAERASSLFSNIDISVCKLSHLTILKKAFFDIWQLQA